MRMSVPVNPEDLGRVSRYWNCRLTTIGRKTGNPRSVTIWFALGEGVVYLTGSKEVPQWCRNLRANGDAVLEIGGLRMRGRARLVEDEDEGRRIRQRFVERYLLARLSRPFGGYSRSLPVVVENLELGDA
jgi:deazaflavin-dependent oxidoreductase (nitroreductase family)